MLKKWDLRQHLYVALSSVTLGVLESRTSDSELYPELCAWLWLYLVLLVPVKWLAVKSISKMTYSASSGTLNPPIPIPLCLSQLHHNWYSQHCTFSSEIDTTNWRHSFTNIWRRLATECHVHSEAIFELEAVISLYINFLELLPNIVLYSMKIFVQKIFCCKRHLFALTDCLY